MELTNNSKFKSVCHYSSYRCFLKTLGVLLHVSCYSGLVPPGPGSSQSQWLGGLTAAWLTNSQMVCLTGSLIKLTFKGLKN